MHPAQSGTPCRVTILPVLFLALTGIAGLIGCEHAAPSRQSAASAGWDSTPAATEARLKATVEYLASDELEGRGVGTEGIDIAAEFLARRMRAAGLQPVPGAVDGHFQPFTMRGETRLEPDTSFSVAGREPLALNREFRPLSFSASTDFAGPVAFVGYAAVDESKGYNDFAEIDVRGRAVIAMRYEPHDESGKSRLTGGDTWSEQGSLVTKAENAAKAGASALLIVNPPNHHGENDRLIAFSRRYTATPSAIPVVMITRDVADDLLARGGVRDLKTLQALIDAEGKPASAVLADEVTVRGKVSVVNEDIKVRNVVAALPGVGPKAGEWVVVGAHYDHLGFGGRGSFAAATQRVVHNGADDNASGTAAVLELAERIAASNRPLPRSVLFIFFSAEESGLLGSEHYVENPLVPLEDTVAMLNLDMVGRVRNGDLAVGGRETAAAFESLMTELDEQSPLTLSRMGRVTFGSSDHASFMKKQIPVLFFFSGLHADYHRPTDDADKINYAGIVQAVELGERTLRSLAAMPRQTYVTPARVARDSENADTQPDRGEPGQRPQLGIVPAYSEDPGAPEGIRVTGTVPNSAAADAGLKDGDVLQGIDGRKMRTLEDLVEFLQGAKVGDRVTLQVLRDGGTVDVPITLRARAGD